MDIYPFRYNGNLPSYSFFYSLGNCLVILTLWSVIRYDAWETTSKAFRKFCNQRVSYVDVLAIHYASIVDNAVMPYFLPLHDIVPSSMRKHVPKLTCFVKVVGCLSLEPQVCSINAYYYLFILVFFFLCTWRALDPNFQ